MFFFFIFLFYFVIFNFSFAGLNEFGQVVEHPGKGIKHICGRQILDNHSVNLLSSIGVALTLPRIANCIWP